MRTAVVTAVRGRAAHLRNQLMGLARSRVQADRHVVVAIDGDVTAAAGGGNGRTLVIPFPSTSPRIPMAEARNHGAQAAIDDGAELLIFLDVDCIPAPDLIGRYARAAEHPDHGSALLCGPVTYLPPPPRGDGYDLTLLPGMVDPHPARPMPGDDEIMTSTDYELFWSLSFGVTAQVWQRIGGFHAGYAGYGGEDTDFAQKAAAEAISMRWVGGAHAFHQFHPVSDPPTEHLHDIVTNAVVFHKRWGWWPMAGWLDAFEAQGLIRRDRQGRPSVLTGS